MHLELYPYIHVEVIDQIEIIYKSRYVRNDAINTTLQRFRLLTLSNNSQRHNDMPTANDPIYSYIDTHYTSTNHNQYRDQIAVEMNPVAQCISPMLTWYP